LPPHPQPIVQVLAVMDGDEPVAFVGCCAEIARKRDSGSSSTKKPTGRDF
jgi:hypothetical protein